MDSKAFMIVLYYELKIKLEMTTPETASTQIQMLFLTTIPYFPWTPELSVTWWLFQFYKANCWHLINSQIKISINTDSLWKHFLMP